MDESGRLVGLLMGDLGIGLEGLSGKEKRWLLQRILEEAGRVMKDLRGLGALETQLKFGTSKPETTTRIPPELLPKGITGKTRVLSIFEDHTISPPFVGEEAELYPKTIKGKEFFLSQDGGVLVRVGYAGTIQKSRKLVQHKKTSSEERKKYEDAFLYKCVVTEVTVLLPFGEDLDVLLMKYPSICRSIVWKIQGELVISEEKAHQLAQRLSRAYTKWETLSQQLRA